MGAWYSPLVTGIASSLLAGGHGAGGSSFLALLLSGYLRTGDEDIFRFHSCFRFRPTRTMVLPTLCCRRETLPISHWGRNRNECVVESRTLLPLACPLGGGDDDVVVVVGACPSFQRIGRRNLSEGGGKGRHC